MHGIIPNQDIILELYDHLNDKGHFYIQTNLTYSLLYDYRRTHSCIMCLKEVT